MLWPDLIRVGRVSECSLGGIAAGQIIGVGQEGMGPVWAHTSMLQNFDPRGMQVPIVPQCH